jgi:hypothetical protein
MVLARNQLLFNCTEIHRMLDNIKVRWDPQCNWIHRHSKHAKLGIAFQPVNDLAVCIQFVAEGRFRLAGSPTRACSRTSCCSGGSIHGRWILSSELLLGVLNLLVAHGLDHESALREGMVQSVKVDTVLRYQTDVFCQFIQRRVLCGGEFLSNGREIHWILDQQRIVWQIESFPVNLQQVQQERNKGNIIH